MDFNELLRVVTVNAIPMIFAITLHEAAHGYVARQFGDSTAYMLGRVTLNPVKHIDPIGTLLFPLITSFTGFVFGWAKPVPVNFGNLRHPRRDMALVAGAGPATNFVQAAIWALVLKMLIVGSSGSLPAQFWAEVAMAGIRWNVALAILNLFPILPLDGGRIVTSLLPGPLAYSYSRLEPYGMIILIVLIVVGALNWVLGPVMNATYRLIFSTFGLR